MPVSRLRVLGGYVLGAEQKLEVDQPLPQQKLRLSHLSSWLDHGHLVPKLLELEIKFSLRKIAEHRSSAVVHSQCPAFIQNYEIYQEAGQNKGKLRRKKIVKKNRPIGDPWIKIISHGIYNKCNFFLE